MSGIQHDVVVVDERGNQIATFRLSWPSTSAVVAAALNGSSDRSSDEIIGAWIGYSLCKNKTEAKQTAQSNGFRFVACIPIILYHARYCVSHFSIIRMWVSDSIHWPLSLSLAASTDA